MRQFVVITLFARFLTSARTYAGAATAGFGVAGQFEAAIVTPQ
jgi:hypothetical protein